MRVHGDAYCYDESSYTCWNNKVRIRCQDHGWFEQKCSNHVSLRQGCPGCGKTKCADSQRLTLKERISQAQLIHGNKYDYSEYVYRNANAPSVIICPTHGRFSQTMYLHVRQKCGCPRCGREQINTKLKLSDQDLLSRLSETYGKDYDYSLVANRQCHDRIPLICRKHGLFYLSIEAIRQAQRCSSCSKKFGRMQNDWLRSLSVDERNWQKRVYLSDGTFIVADAFDPCTRTIYEFWGDYHHGNPRIFEPDQIHSPSGLTMQELHGKTLDKIRKIEQSGFTLVHIWESDWKRS